MGSNFKNQDRPISDKKRLANFRPLVIINYPTCREGLNRKKPEDFKMLKPLTTVAQSLYIWIFAIEKPEVTLPRQIVLPFAVNDLAPANRILKKCLFQVSKFPRQHFWIFWISNKSSYRRWKCHNFKWFGPISRFKVSENRVYHQTGKKNIYIYLNI